MRDRLLHWWPALPALLILYLGGSSFLEKYPRSQGRSANLFARSGGPDSLLAFVRKGAAAVADTVPADPSLNPFRPIHAPRPAGQSPTAPQAEPPPRRYVLKGTVGSNVATITNNAGQKLIVKIGDRIDSAEVISIEANKVVLKDRAGRFELLNEK
ncbi:MAG: hypothetical protein JWP91_3518 [Fibrobacteres bacterium]|nr:hypothetical protein [Fibrobacterota bacterium]